MAMTKKNFEKAAAIVRAHRDLLSGETNSSRITTIVQTADAIEDAFVMLFANDNPHYDVARFRVACRK